MPSTPKFFIAPNPYVKWKFDASTATQKNAKKKQATKFLRFYLDGVEETLSKFDIDLHFNIESKIVPNGRNKFIFEAKVWRRPVIVGSPESGKDPKKPSPPPPL